jgi:hypothetical protein
MAERPQNKNLLKGDERHKFTPEEHSKGGKASAKARREKADLRKQLQIFLQEEATKDKNGEPLTGAELMVKVAVKEMTKGNPKYWELIRDTAGQKPIDKIQVAEVDADVISEVEKAVLED